jgi:amino acid adenylation domain-containing protein
MIIERFQQQVKKYPGKLAVNTQKGSLTYDELDKLSNRIADKIRAIPGQRSKKSNIGILMESGSDMIAAILGILKSGNTYVPLVADFPAKRINFIIHHAEIDIFITDSINKNLVSGASKDKDLHWLMIEDMNKENPGSTSDILTFTRDIYEDTDAYLLYTSGSTGFPKGVRQTHLNILHFIDHYTENLELTSRDNLTLFSSFSHDASVMDIYSALLNGATLFPLDLKQVGVFSTLTQWLKTESISVWHSVPTVFRYFVASLTAKVDLPDLRCVILGGETVLRSDIEKFHSLFPTGSRLYNLYGQTESTYNSGDFFTVGQPGDDANEITITLGEPVQDTELVVVDEKGDETDPMEVGEIIVVSPHVSPGYWKDEESTREKFVNDPEAGRIYFTGDLGCCLPDGRVEYLGRKDHQVKIRGYRVELGEIESTVMQYPHIEQAAVIPVESVSRDSREIFIACYFSANKDIVMSSLREFLQERLLDYMIPSYFRPLLQLPKTISGKIDRKALPAPSLAISKEYAAPVNEIEQKLAAIWADLLDIGKVVIGTNNSFFELGGHSLKATLLAARIFKEFEVNVSLTVIFERQTIKGLSQYILQAGQGKYTSIQPVEKREFYPLSSAQKRLYFLHQLEGIGTSYNLPFLFRLKKALDREQLEYTCRRLIERHEILRTCFEMKDQDPVQRVFAAGEVNFAVDYYEVSPGNEQDTLRSFIRAFDLAKAPLMRIGLLKTGNRYTFLGDFHHIIADGMSLNVLEADFLAIYDGKTLPGSRVHYKDYTQWQLSERQQAVLKKQGEYWLQTFKGQLPVLALPYDYPRPSNQSFSGKIVSFVLKEKETMRLKEITAELEVTLYMLLLAAYNVLLGRLSNQEDILVGTPIAGRNHADLQNLLGMFVNTIIIRNYPRGEKRFIDFLNEVKQNTIAAFENREFPFEDLVESLAVPRDTSRNPLFDVIFNLLDERNYQYEISESVEQSALLYLKDTSMFDLNLTVIDRGHGLVFRFEYSTRLFKPETMERFLRYFKNILSVISISPWEKLSEIEILTEGEKEQILEMCNGVEVSYGTSQTIDRLFEEQAAKTPDHVALVGVYETHKKHEKKYNMSYLSYMSYQKLNEKSNQLAGYLIEKGAGFDTIVGIMMERSIEMVIGIMGILKAGAVYLPIDPEYPQERIKFMLKDSGTKILVTTPSINNYQLTINNLQLKGSNLAYIIYTSGSTGRPKGVMVEHQGLVNLMKYHYQYTNLDYSRVTQFASISFDVSFQEIFFTLLAGGTLVVLDKQTKTDIPQLCRIIRENRVQTVFLPISFIKAIFSDENYADQFPGTISHIVCAGEQMVVIDRFRTYLQENNIYLHNHYGPSETHVVTSLTLEPKGEIPGLPSIGTPISNTKIYILDKALNLQPPGVVGELYIGGAAPGRGYLNNPELTFERFLSVSHRSYKSYMSYISKEIYRTGDLARWLADGNIEFLDRIDHQVKIRGYRIELEEIQQLLLKQEDVKDAVVVAKVDQSGDRYLCAYIVAKSPGQGAPIGAQSARREETSLAVDTTELRAFLSKKLPGYMIPSFFVYLEEIPLTASGKIDRRALPEPDPGKVAGSRYQPPRDELEKKLVKIWSEILPGRDSLPGIDDNFFDLGGHSLKATVLVSRIHQQLDVKVPLAVLFKQPSIRALAEFIKKKDQDRFFGIEPVEKREYYPIAPAQKRLFILQQMDLKSIVYNIPFTLLVEGEPNINFMERVFRRLIQKHECMRTSFHMIDNQPIQKIHDHVEFKIEYDRSLVGEEDRSSSDCQGRGEVSSPDEIETIIRDFTRPFALGQAPLLRVGLIRSSETEHILMVDMHHIISDGISMNILVKEFMLHYGSKEPVPLVHPVRYKDYSQWFNIQREAGYFNKQEAYWLKEFSDDIPCLDLPLDYPRPAVYHFEGSRASFELPREQGRRLRQLTREQNATLFMTLMALFNVFLAKLSGQEDIVVGSPIAGRPHSQLQDIIGMFVNTLALRNYPSSVKTFREFLAEIKQKSLAAFENQVHPFEELVEKAVLTRDIGRNPLFDVMLMVQNLEEQELQIPGLPIRPYPFEIKVSKFDMTWTVVETEEEDRLDFIIVYCTRLFKPGTIHRFWGYFRQLVEAVLQNPGVLLADIEIISPAEKQEILYGFNHENARIGYPKGKTIHDLFAEQSERTPDHIGVRLSEGTRGLAPLSEPITLTYRKLNQQSSQLAHGLKAKGIQTDTIVAIMVEPSIEMIIGILGILKAGGAYMPIDPEYPNERIRYMLKDSGAKILMTTPGLSEEFNRLSIVNCQLLIVNEMLTNRRRLNNPPKEANSINNYQLTINNLQLECFNLAYIIYTSGTTGRPKGSLIDHRNVVRLMTNDRFRFDFTDNDVWTLFHSYCFDFSVWEMYGALLYGGKLVIIPRMTAKDTIDFLQVLKQEKVTVLNQTPSAFYQLMTQESKAENKELNLKYVIFGGEALNPSKLKAWNRRYPGTRLINMYGITETTVHVTYKEIQEQDLESPASCIGLPIPTLTAYVMDRHFKLQPVGVPGELCIGGQGVSRGYLNRPELTIEKFDQDLWDLQDYQDNYRSYGSYKSYIYRTGDLVRWLPDGDIEYLGRIDHQVKIRGYRIELGEIENLLLKQNAVKDSVVIAKEDQSGDCYLCAYIVHEESCTPDSPHSSQSTKLREYLSRQLPSYMVPSFFVYLEEIPLTPNGKINRKALPDPVFQPGKSYTSPRNSIEEKLVEIWREVLLPDQSSASIGIDDNFFQTGGHSLKAISVVNAVHKVFNVQISIQDIFIAPTIGELASIISEQETVPFAGIVPLPRREYYELSYAQARLWVLHKRDPGSPAFNMPEKVTFHERLEKDNIQDILTHLATRHESLRTYFTEVKGQVVQKIAPQVTIDVKMIDLSHLEEELYEQREQIYAEESLIPFDLEKAPLLRVKIVKCREEEFDLIFTMHHLVSDGWSLEILHQEFYRYYKSIKEGRPFIPEPVKVHYKDYAHWHNQLLADREKLSEVLEFWQHQLIEPPILELPYDFPPGDLTGKKSAAYRAVVDPNTTGKLKSLARDYQASVFMVLLASFNVLLWQLTGQENILIGMPGAARQHEDIKNTIGLFVNTLVLRTPVDKNQTFENFLQAIQSHVMKMLEYQGYPLELLCEELAVRYPAISLFFNMVNTGDSTRERIPGLDTGHIENVQEAKFHMALYLVEYQDGIDILCTYYSQLFLPETVEKIISNYIQLLQKAAAEPKRLIKEYRPTRKRLLKKSFASGGQGDSFRENRPPGPVKHPQKLLIKGVINVD